MPELRARALTRAALLFFVSLLPSVAQQPFYTDDPSVTEKGKFHFELFNEFDALQRELRPNLRQNTTSYRLNFGLPGNLELDIDNPLLAIFRADGVVPRRSAGFGDTNTGIKWNFHQEKDHSPLPAMSATFYVEFPTGDQRRQLGSGLIDYWLNGIVQKSLRARTKITVNTGILFAGNTSTGLIGIQTTRGHVITFGASLIRKFTEKWELGGEVYGGVTGDLNLAKGQLQFLTGGHYKIRKEFSLDFGVLGGKYVASPRVGVQLGFSVDFQAK